MKECVKCQQVKFLDDFPKAKRHSSGRSSYCLECNRENVKSWSQTEHGKARLKAASEKYRNSEKGRARKQALQSTPEQKAKAYARKQARRKTQAGACREFEVWLRRNYGITVHEWALMYNAQERTCPGCSVRLEVDRHTHVDHCHRTGKVRALLCAGCNKALGCIADKPDTLRSLALYLEAHAQD